MVQEQYPFEPDDPEYICCCGCHVMTGAKIIACLHSFIIIFYTAVLIGLLIDGIRKNDTSELGGAGFVGCYLLINVVINVCFWYGLIKEREEYLSPTVIDKAVTLALLSLLPAIGVLVYFAEIIGTLSEQAASSVLAIMLVLFAVILCGLRCWFYEIIKSAYCYIKHKRLLSAIRIVIVQRIRPVLIAVPEVDSPPPQYDDSAPPPYDDFAPPSYDLVVNEAVNSGLI